jgi:hypothetical protein
LETVIDERSPMRVGSNHWDKAAYALFLALAIVILLTFRDYGIGWDEPEAQEYGQFILDYYRTDGARPRALTYNNMYYYGGLFEATAVWLGELLPFDPFETRHLLNAAVGLLGIVGAWKLGRLLGGPKVGLLAALFLAAVPSYYGHMFLNSKDIPFAAAAVWALYYTVLVVRALPRPHLGLAMRLGFMEDTVVAFRGIEWKFTKPVFIGDTVRLRVAVEETKAMPRLGAGLVTFRMEVINQRNEVVHRGSWELLCKGREATTEAGTR